MMSGHLQQQLHNFNNKQPSSTSSRTALISPTTSEHQYDIPFSHLTNKQQQQQQQQPDYDNVINSNWGGGSLLQPRVVNGMGKAWSGSEKSIDTSVYSEEEPSAALFNLNASMGGSCVNINPDTFAFATVTHTGKTVALNALGVTLTIPEGALDKGYTEEVRVSITIGGEKY